MRVIANLETGYPKSSASALTFGRSFTPQEAVLNKAAIQSALDYLEKDSLALIVPQAAFPSETNKMNMGVGSAFNKSGKMFSVDMALWGFNKRQDLPNGMMGRVNPTPYDSSIFSGNTMSIDLEELTKQEWGKILSPETISDIKSNRPDAEEVNVPDSFEPDNNIFHKRTISGDNIAYYNYYQEKSYAALEEAFQNFKEGRGKNEKLKKVDAEFQAFRQDEASAYWLERDALYDALGVLYGEDYYKYWDTEKAPDLSDKTPIKPDSARDARLFETDDWQERVNEIKTDPFLGDKMELYMFKQFIYAKQNKETWEFNQEVGRQLAEKINNWNHTDKRDADKLTLKTIGDGQVSVGSRDKWAHPDAFVKGWELNCPPKMNWGFPILNLNQLHNADGTLAAAGKFLHEKFNKIFRENKGGARIDHAQGIIDPWVAPEGKLCNHPDAGKLLSSPDNPKLASFSYLTMNNINTHLSHEPDKDNRMRWNRYKEESISQEQYDRYGQPVDLVLKAAKENGTDKKDVIFEEFENASPVSSKVLADRGASKIVQSRWGSTDYFKDSSWAMFGNHDNPSMKEWAEDIFKEHKSSRDKKNTELAKQVEHLKRELGINKKVVNKILEGGEESMRIFKKLQFVKLFASDAKSIQIFFPDLFGTEECYNRVIKPDAMDWRPRISADYDAQYTNALIKDQALNIPEVLSLTIRSRCAKNNAELPEKILRQLDYYARVLKEDDRWPVNGYQITQEKMDYLEVKA